MTTTAQLGDITITITIDLTAQTAVFRHRTSDYPEAYGMEIVPITSDDYPEEYAAGLRFILTDDSDADPTFYATFRDALFAAWNYALENAGLS